jgi:hypothetical protein
MLVCTIFFFIEIVRKIQKALPQQKFISDSYSSFIRYISFYKHVVLVLTYTFENVLYKFALRVTVFT